ncbi:MAG: hypothetical protein QOC96_3764 [Acidobacteriota bacterium]|jgi:hypothetical protein|nr:hypothetical protein [Acidobacteriota bacterium]
MAIVSKPDRENKHTLYDVPDEVLAQYSIPADKLTQMFPKKEGHDRTEAVAIVAAGSGDSEVEGYSGQDICYAWECDGYGNCVYVWWYC